MITREQGLRTWASRWSRLKAWQYDLSEVKIKVSDRSFPDRLGTCWSAEQRITIYRGASFVEELTTLVHELAHAATVGAHHDERWQRVYAAAVTEITGTVVTPAANNYRLLDDAAHRVMRQWWRTSGNQAIWNLARTA